jgi:predicted metalloprotease
MHVRRAPLATILVTILATMLAATGCTTLVAGTPIRARTVPQGLNCVRVSAQATVTCLAESLSAFWTRRAGRTVTMRAVVDPSPDVVPKGCRAALRLNTAFSCPADDRVYLTARFLHEMDATGPPQEAWLRIASTMGHEMGHILQFTVHDRLAEKRHITDAQLRTVEQQADCLAGAWAGSVGIDPAQYVRANAVVLGIVDTDVEERTHGTVAQRLAMVRQGLQGRTAASCGLTLR